MLRRAAPLSWRRGWQLHRRRQGADGYGDPTARYDMARPDFTAEDGSPEGVCWQRVRTWQSAGAVRDGGELLPGGERTGGLLQGVLFGGPEVAVFDRFVIDGAVYELRGVERWPSHRLLLLRRVN